MKKRMAWPRIVSIRAVALARTSRTARLRVLPARDALVVHSLEYRHRSRPRQDRRPPHQPRFRRLFCKRSCLCVRPANRFTSSSTVSPPTKSWWTESSSNNIRRFGFTSTYGRIKNNFFRYNACTSLVRARARKLWVEQRGELTLETLNSPGSSQHRNQHEATYARRA